MDDFPSLKASQLLAVLMRKPLSYRVVRQRGSHRVLKAEGRPRLMFSFHDRRTISPKTVEKVLCTDVGLAREDALRLL
jgi:predicted RNA binding protein YcfA (HicA-like mRNA interferase family)